MNSSLNTGNTNQKKEYVAVYFLLSLLVTVFLIYIDEGNYNFNWIYSWGNWVVFLIYAFGIFSGQILAQHFLFKKMTTVNRILLSFFVGGGVGLAAVIIMFISLLNQ